MEKRITALEADLGTKKRRAIAKEVGVSETTLHHWEKNGQLPKLANCMALDRRLPNIKPSMTEVWFVETARREGVEDQFGFLEEIRNQLLRPDFVAGEADDVSQLAAGYQKVVEALSAEPPRGHPKRIRHCAFHTIDPDQVPPLELRPHLDAFGAVMQGRIEEGWDVKTLYFVPTTRRLEEIYSRCSLSSVLYEVRAIPSPPVPMLSPLVVSDSHCFIAYDNNGLGRAGDVLQFVSRPEMIAWALRYFDVAFGTWGSDLYILRDKSGPQEKEYARMRTRLSL